MSASRRDSASALSIRPSSTCSISSRSVDWPPSSVARFQPSQSDAAQADDSWSNAARDQPSATANPHSLAQADATRVAGGAVNCCSQYAGGTSTSRAVSQCARSPTPLGGLAGIASRSHVASNFAGGVASRTPAGGPARVDLTRAHTPPAGGWYL